MDQRVALRGSPNKDVMVEYTTPGIVDSALKVTHILSLLGKYVVWIICHRLMTLISLLGSLAHRLAVSNDQDGVLWRPTLVHRRTQDNIPAMMNGLRVRHVVDMFRVLLPW